MIDPIPELLEACEEWLYQNDLLSKGMGQLLAAFVQAREQAAHERGANWMLDAVRASLKGYPNHGGDIEVMQEVERIKQAARLDEAKMVAQHAAAGSGGQLFRD